MNDYAELAARLRAREQGRYATHPTLGTTYLVGAAPDADSQAAADAIEALQARVAELDGALRELVTLQDLKDEESRLRQRRECTRLRGSEEVRRKVNAMRDDYNRRKPLAWAAARNALESPNER